MKRGKNWQKVLGILVATVVLVLGSVLVFNTTQRGSGQQVVSAVDVSTTPASLPITTTGISQGKTPTTTEVLLTATTQTEEMPMCVFDEPTIAGTNDIVTLDAYTFSEPQVVLTSSTALGIAGWLPDNERLLLTRHAPNGRQVIETLNIRSGERQVYAERQGANGNPLWIASLNAVAYATSVDSHKELWLSSGDPQSAMSIAPDVEGLSLATDGTQVVYFSPAVSGDQPRIWNAVQQTEQALSLDLGEQLTQVKVKAMSLDNNKLTPGRTFHTAWQPGGTKLAFYGHTWLILFDQQTQQTCQVDFEQLDGKAYSILQAQWSSNGRYLALSGSMYFYGIPPTLRELIILDTMTGELYSINFEAQYMGDIVWLSDNQTLMGLGLRQTELEKGRSQQGLFGGSLFNEKLQPILSSYLFGGGAGSGQLMKLSPNGHNIAVKCPIWPEAEKTIRQDRICVIDITVKP